MDKVNLTEKFSLIHDYWKPKIVAELNDSYVKLAKFRGNFIWHHHENEDELFLVVKGQLIIKLQDGGIRLNEGEFFIVPKEIEHKPVAEGEVHVMLIEPKMTLNTGNVSNERTAAILERI